MFGRESLPSIVFSFGCRLERQSELVWDQLRMAHRYRNRLVEIERQRRQETDVCVAEACPDLGSTESALACVVAQIEAAESQVLKTRQDKRAPAEKEQSAQLKALRSTRKQLYARRKQLRQDTFARLDVRSRLNQIDAADSERRKEARANCKLYWGTYLAIEQDCGGIRSGPPPKFQRWTGDGRLAVQLQGGLSPATALAGDDKRLIIEPLEDARTGRRKGRRHRVWFRVGTATREPLWATVLAEIHRPLPEDCQIKWVYLVARRIGTHTQWSVQFVASRESGWAKPGATDGTVAINLGWRSLPDGTMRVATWVGDDGQAGTLCLDQRLLESEGRTAGLGSVRDLNFNAAVLQLRQWLASQSAVPDWLREATTHLPQWRSPGRLARLAIDWRDQRFDGDGEVFNTLEAWRKQDRHLLEWQANERQATQAERLDLYRTFAATLRQQYRTVVLAKVDYRHFAVEPLPEDGDDIGNTMRRRRRQASPSILTAALKHSFAEVHELSPVDITSVCHVCGQPSRETERVQLIHACRQCGSSWDQDRNACLNLLKLASSQVAEVVP